MRPLRNRDPKVIHLLTNRTERSELLMVPRPEVVATIGGIIGKYQRIHKVRIYDLIFLSNHYHIQASQPEGDIWRFMADVDREVAKRINKIAGRTGRFWKRRYTDQEVLEDGDQLEAKAYIETNSTHHGLVEKPEDWPGLCKSNCQGVEFPFLNQTAFSLALARNPEADPEDFTTYHRIEISELPCLEEKTEKEAGALKQEAIERRLELVRKNNTKGYLGVNKILSQPFGLLPSNSKTSRRSPFYSRCSSALNNAYSLLKGLNEAYREASENFRSGILDTSFPEFTFKPPLHYVPRSLAEPA